MRWNFVMPAAVLAAACAAGCASSGRLPAPPLGGPVWPPAPEVARIQWVGEIRGPADLGLRPGFLGSLLDVLAGTGPTRFLHPYGVAVWGEAAGTGPGGGGEPGPARMAVADTDAGVVHLFDLAAGEHRVLRSAGEGGGALVSPVAVAFEGEGRLLVCDSARAEVLRYDGSGRFLGVLLRGLGRPAGIAVDPVRGRLFVSDAASHAVVSYDLGGAPLRALPLDLRFPTHLFAEAGGTLLVSDSMNFRVLRVDPDGAPLCAVGGLGDGSGDLQRPRGVASDPEGHLYAVDALFDNVQIFDGKGGFLLAFGSAGTGPGEFTLPAGLFLDSRGLIYAADSYNGRVQVFRFLREER